MKANDSNNELRRCLKEQGHSDREIKEMLVKMEHYDRLTVYDSLYESLGASELQLDEWVKSN